eukprot:scaffold34365_cov27-Tisochrysis_lutea.AAC.1
MASSCTCSPSTARLVPHAHDARARRLPDRQGREARGEGIDARGRAKRTCAGEPLGDQGEGVHASVRQVAGQPAGPEVT